MAGDAAAQTADARAAVPHLGRAIRARRRALDLTLKDLGLRSGLSVGFLSQLERDLATPSLSALSGIAGALGASRSMPSWPRRARPAA
ncbi:transcriptional regulator with XRE-family HTH domain [Inquilinus ginsengisoli]|uniref:helix-turn-helix domain-containing protein n=1 Tax=Inquilinus ginsengisoli TaxID=363840 RepID=UPI003D258426